MKNVVVLIYVTTEVLPMPTLLESLYYGKLIPSETTAPQDPEYRQLNRQISESMDAWKSKLSEKDFEELESLFDLYQSFKEWSWRLPLHKGSGLERG